MLTYPNFNSVALHLGPLQIRWYGLMYVVGFLAAWWLGRRRAADPRSTWTPVDVDDLVFYCVFGVILGGRLGYLLFYGQQALAADPSYWYKIWLGGMSFHGGLVGVIVSLIVLAKVRKRSILDVFDFTAPLPGIGICAVRVGNFINGELWGKPTTAPWGFALHEPDGSTVVLHASQLYEATLEGLMTFVVVWIYTRVPRPRGVPAGLFLCLYALSRIAVEFVRVPDVQLGYLYFDWVTMGQILSLPMLAVGLGLIANGALRRQPSGNYAATG